MELIDKDEIVLEIERRIKELEPFRTEDNLRAHGAIAGYYQILSFIRSLKVKDVNLENSVKGRIDYPLIGADFPNIYPNYKELKDYCDKNGIKDEDEVKIIIIKDE